METVLPWEPGVGARLWALWTPGSVTKLHTHWTPTLPPKAPLPFPCVQRTATSHQHLPTQKEAFEIARLQTVTQSHKIKGQIIGSQHWFGDQALQIKLAANLISTAGDSQCFEPRAECQPTESFCPSCLSSVLNSPVMLSR